MKPFKKNITRVRRCKKCVCPKEKLTEQVADERSGWGDFAECGVWVCWMDPESGRCKGASVALEEWKKTQ